jgi:predicted enzyme related to lactoylglutathione lyase
MSTQQSLVTRVDFTTIPTQNFAAAEEFYGNVLGLPCSVRYGSMDGAEFETGNLTLSVIDASIMPMEFSPNQNLIALHVDDVAAAREQLESRGVQFMGDTMDTGVCHMAFFRDPDGNGFLLHHRYAPRD